MIAHPLRRITLFVATLICLGITMPALAKRTAPTPVKPVSINGADYRIRYERIELDQRPAGIRAYVVAKNEKTGEELWTARLYEVTYKSDLETDVQDVYVTRLTTTADGLLAKTETSREFLVDLSQHTVREIAKK